MEIFDISQTLLEGIVTWPGDPEFRLRRVASVSNGESSNVSALQMGTHAGTHIDAPLHVADSGGDVTAIPIRSCIGPVRVIDFPGRECIRAADLASIEWQGVERVLFKTRSSRDSESLFSENYVYLDESASALLGKRGMLLVGIDAPSVDPFDSVDLRSHKALLKRGVVILENLRLDHVAPGDYNLVCLPLKIAAADGSPVRAVLWR